MKIKKAFPDNPDYSDMLMFRCPACGGNHMISIGPKSYWNIRWQFNGDYDKPTVNPSVLVTHEIPAIRVWESWNGGTMNDVRRDMDALGKLVEPLRKAMEDKK